MQDADAPEFTATPRVPRLRRALRRGVRFKVKANERCAITVRMTRRGKLMAKGSGSLTAAGTTAVTARFTRRARRKLRNLNKVRLKVRIAATDASGNKSFGSGTLTLRR